jgi:hypothetical protein
MEFKKGCKGKSTANFWNLLLIAGFSIASSITGPTAIAAWGYPYYEIVAEQVQQSPATLSNKAEDPTKLDLAKQSAKANIKASLDDVRKLRNLNWAWSISFIVTGITLTLVATSLGAVESQNEDVKKWTKFAIVALGAGAVAAQSLNASFPVKTKEAEFADIYWNLMSLQTEIDNVSTDDELRKVVSAHAGVLKRIGEVESSPDQTK